MLTVACGRDGFGVFGRHAGDGGRDSPDDNPNDGVELGPISTRPLVANLSNRWNQYVTTPGSDPLSWTTPCLDAGSYTTCRHAGELHRVDVPNARDCSGLSLVDSADAFIWECRPAAQGVTFVSRGFKTGRGLRDLLDFSAIAFRPMSTTLRSGGRSWTSPVTSWWTNDVAELQSCGGALCGLAAPETVYIATTSLTNAGYNIAANGIALVTAPGALLSGVTADNKCVTFDVITFNYTSRPCVINALEQARFWLEADLARFDDSANRAIGIGLNRSRLGEVHGTSFGQGFDAPLALVDARAVRVTDVRVNRATDGNGSVMVAGSNANVFRNLRLAGAGIYLRDSNDNALDEVTVFDNYNGVIENNAAGRNAYTRLLSFSHAQWAVALSAQAPSTVVGFTAANSAQESFLSFGETGGTFHLGAVLNSTNSGIVSKHANTTLSHVASVGHSGPDLIVENAPHRLSGALTVGSQDECSVINTTQPGYTATCQPADLSDFTAGFVQRVDTTFVGFVTRDDVGNASDSNGASSIQSSDAAFDYVGAENRYRGWTIDAGSALNEANAGCPGHSTNCFEQIGDAMRLFDFSLRTSDTLLRNRATAEPFSTGACRDTLGATTFDISGGETAGDAVGDDDGVCEPGEVCAGRTYLLAAIELADDNVGNDNGLCEAGEHCLFAPNLGAYQGHGDYRTRSCAFADGTVLYAYPENGY